GLVIYSEGTVFSAGANLNVFLELFKSNDTEKLKAFILKGQKAYTDLRYAKFPSVAAVTSLTLGGGAEFALHSGAIQAHTETVMGLVELGVGLIPCWGGCTALLCRAYEKTGDAKAAILHTFETIAGMKKSPSAFQARDLLFLRETDKFTMNKDRLLFDAKQRVLSMVNGYEPRKECVISIPADAKGAVQSIIEKSQGHDTAVLEALQNVLCSGGSESDIRELECSEVLKLKDKDKTEARIANMLSTGKPLKN
ncbi:MAG: enoyl-CoA hydratase/isomerase family protein, partial [Alphaproteobacteria bacterium]|nr:enoyl-CoA hydratase/isomerase family protein [Alphaproteobacteria bacterium]